MRATHIPTAWWNPMGKRPLCSNRIIRAAQKKQELRRYAGECWCGHRVLVRFKGALFCEKCGKLNQVMQFNPN